MTNVILSRMLRGKVRSNTCRIIILTSIVWVLVDIVILMHYVGLFGPADTIGRRPGEYEVEVSVNAIQNYTRVHGECELHVNLSSNSLIILPDLPARIETHCR